MKRAAGIMLALLTCAAPAAAQQNPHQHQADMDHRGHQAMGFDQSKSRHTFTTNDRGGTIEAVAVDARDTTTIGQIRSHMREIAKLFKNGDFSKPLFIHAQNPPGADAMKTRRADIDYRVEDLPAGARIIVSSADPGAIAAIHAFLRFQQNEHK
jgi:hypothetical protein